MALPADSVFEYQTGGNNNNGGGYAASYGGTDYSQSTTPILDLATWSCAAGSTTITTSSGGLTAAMVGNVWNLHTPNGTSNVAGLYMITAITDANTMTIDRSIGPSAMTNGTGRIGGCLAIPLDAHFETFVAGNKAYIKSGNYTITASISVASSSATSGSPIVIEGYYSSRGDFPIESNLPVLQCGTYSITFGTFWGIRYLSGAGSSSPVFASSSSGGAFFNNCKVLNNSSTADRTALYLRNSTAFSCNLSSTNGYACYSDVSNQSMLICCNLHDSKNGCTGASAYFVIENCAIYNCTNAAFTTGAAKNIISFSVIYNCNGGVKFVNYGYSSIVNCIISANTTGLSQNANYITNFAKNCLFYDNDTDASNFTLDSSNITGSDPLFNDPSNGDFTLVGNSPALNMGFDFSKIGLVGAYKSNIGLYQGDNAITGAPFFGWVA